MPKYERENNIKKCRKCRQPMNHKVNPESIKKYCLEEYVPDTSLCVGCNAVESLIMKMQQKKEITLEDCKILPKYMVFDPNNDNPTEVAYAQTFQEIADKYAKELQEEAATV